MLAKEAKAKDSSLELHRKLGLSTIMRDDDEEQAIPFESGVIAITTAREVIVDEGQMIDKPSWKQCVLLLPLFLAAAVVLGYELGSSDFELLPGSSSRPRTTRAIVAIDEKNAAAPHAPFPLYNETFTDYLVHGMKKILAANNDDNEHYSSIKHRKKHYVYDSPYERRWPDSDVPRWARKIIPYNRHIPSDKEICFVHVGKSGGSTVGCMLGFSIHCDEDKEINGLLPIVTTHAFHRGTNDCENDAAYYLFVVRDPLARLMSAFNYARPNMTKYEPFKKGKFHEKSLYLDCNFWTLEDLAQNGLLNEITDEASHRCRYRAIGAVTGQGKYFTHSYFNYQYYSQTVFHTEDNRDASTVPESANNLLVIRNKHIIGDWNAINELIGGQPDLLMPSNIPVNNAHAKNANELYLSDSSKMALCQALCNEIQVYKEIIRHGINLSDDDIDQSMEELRQSCPIEAVVNTCPKERPNMQHRIEQRRGDLK